MGDRLKKLASIAWLGDDAIRLHNNPNLYNPLENFPDDENSLYRALMDFRNLSFICRTFLNINILPLQSVILEEMWFRPFPMLIGSRGMGKTFLLAVYALLRAMLYPRRKIVITGGAFRQAKYVFEYCDTIWQRAPLLREFVGTAGRQGPRRDIDRCVMHIGESTITALPLGDGSKIRGERANDIIADEFSSIPEEVYETVVAGFAAVTATPVENVQLESAKRFLEKAGHTSIFDEAKATMGNQAVLSGTAYYDFNSFAKYWKKYRDIIKSQGDKEKLKQIHDGEEPPENFDWRDYSIIRIPVELLPKGFMDEKHVARSRATVHSGVFQMEYGAVFSTDSQGFFRRKLIESCVTNQPIIRPSGPVQFEAVVHGNPNSLHVFGVDPASEVDNFAIVILEIQGDHRRIVYSWTINRPRHKEMVAAGLAVEHDYYSYCARKIRELMHKFPCVFMGIDPMGGGVGIMEALQDPDKLRGREERIFPVIEEDKEKDTDFESGLHIIHVANFPSSDWTSEANHGMRKDFEDKVLLFPRFDSVSLGLSIERDKDAILAGDKLREYDTLEGCVVEIEELKDELASIIMSQTGITGRDRWDTPEVKLPGGKKGRLRKDRYSALLIANMVARTLERAPEPVRFQEVGIAVNRAKPTGGRGRMYYGPQWYKDFSASCALGVKKNR